MRSDKDVNYDKLLGFLRILDSELKKKIILIAAGGTAMALLKLKPSTRDIDFTLPKEDYEEFEKTLKKIPHGFKIDSWPDGYIFSQQLPADYLDKSIPIEFNAKNIELRALHPIDIIATKIGRLDERDIEDIKECIKQHNLTKQEITNRSKQVEYLNEEIADNNLKYVLSQLF